MYVIWLFTESALESTTGDSSLLDSWIKELESGIQGMAGVAGLEAPVVEVSAAFLWSQSLIIVSGVWAEAHIAVIIISRMVARI